MSEFTKKVDESESIKWGPSWQRGKVEYSVLLRTYIVNEYECLFHILP